MPREGHDQTPQRANVRRNTFQSTCPARGTTPRAARACRLYPFQSTCPARGTTPATASARCPQRNFNPRAPRGARRAAPGGAAGKGDFNPRAPRGARLLLAADVRDAAISIHVPREGHDRLSWFPLCVFLLISIHVPREGHDFLHHFIICFEFIISIHVPREGHDRDFSRCSSPALYFNPRAPRGARLLSRCAFIYKV